MDIISEIHEDPIIEEEPKKSSLIPETQKGKVILAGVGGLAVVTLAVLTFSYSSFVGTRAIGNYGPRVAVQQGETLSLKFPLKQASMGRVVEICNKVVFKTVCKSLPVKIGKDPSMVDVVVPINYKVGNADLRMTGIYRNGVKVLVGLRAVLVKPFVSNGSGNGNGNGNGNNGNGNGSNSTPLPYSITTPTPVPPYTVTSPTPTAPLPY